jgi:hypothetical protein
VQAKVVGEAAEQVGRGDHEDAAEHLGAGVSGVAVAGRGGQGERQRQRVEVGQARPAHRQPGDGEGRLAGQPEHTETGGGDGQGYPQQRHGPPGAADEIRAADPAEEDAEVEAAHRGGGLGGAQSGRDEHFGAEIDRAELDGDAHGDHGGQQPAGPR